MSHTVLGQSIRLYVHCKEYINSHWKIFDFLRCIALYSYTKMLKNTIQMLEPKSLLQTPLAIIWCHQITMMLHWAHIHPPNTFCTRTGEKQKIDVMILLFWYCIHKAPFFSITHFALLKRRSISKPRPLWQSGCCIVVERGRKNQYWYP